MRTNQNKKKRKKQRHTRQGQGLRFTTSLLLFLLTGATDESSSLQIKTKRKEKSNGIHDKVKDLTGATDESSSLFTYGPGDTHRDYFDNSYVPTFMEGYDPVIAKMEEGARKTALMTCEQSFQCIFDIAVTGRSDVGKATKEFQEWLLGMKRILHGKGETRKLT